MNEIMFGLDKVQYRSKPEGTEIGKINNRIAKNVCYIPRGDINDFRILAELVGNKGATLSPATYRNGSRCNNNFEQQQLFALDFDNKDPKRRISFDEVKERAERYELPILFAYESFSSVDGDRFRVVFLNDASIPELRVAEIMLQSLMTVFPECDPQSKSPVQMYFGGKRLIHFDEKLPEIDILSTVVGMTKYLEDRWGKTNYKKKVAEFIRSNRLATNKRGMPDIRLTFDPPTSANDAEIIGVSQNDNNSPNLTILKNESIIVGFGENLLDKYYLINYNNNTGNSATKRTPRNHLAYRSSDINKIRSGCRLFREFESGERRLHHGELFGLATNLVQVETGASLFLELFRKNSSADGRAWKNSYWQHQIKNFKSSFAWWCVNP